MKTQTLALVALASSAQLASATFDWLDAKKFSCPSNTDNVCIPSQKSGFSWGGLSLGSFTGFGGFDFSGFECADSFDGKSKRDHITGRTFQNKCIKGKATPDKSSAPSFGCGSSKEVEKFSVKEFQVSVEFDCELEFHYDMPDGSTCKQKSACKKSGTTVKNTQCGGAKNVKVILPSGSGGGKKSCDVGFHHIDFDCAPPASTKPPVSTTPAESSVPATTPAESEVYTTTSATPETTLSTASESGIESTSVVPPFPANSTIPTGAETVPATSPPTPTSFTTSTVFETQVSTIISCAESVKDCPAASTILTTITTAISTTICPVTESETPSPSSEVPPSTPLSSLEVSTTTSETPVESTSSAEGLTSETPAPTFTSSAEGLTSEAPTPTPVDVTTVIIETSTTLCPVTKTHTSEGITSIETGISTSTVFSTITSTVCTKCTIKPTSAAETSEGITSSPVSQSDKPTTVIVSETPSPTAPCPAVLPQCLNTWLFSSGCKSNTDAQCFCESSDFVDAVYQCLAAYGASDDEVDSAQSYFQGICAAHIPSNPAIVTGANTLTITASAGGSAPVTTIQLLTTIIVPCTATEGPSSGSLIPDSSTTTILSTALTVPQVVFQTITGTSTAAVSLIEGTAPAYTGPGITTPVATSVPTTFASIPVPSPSNGTAVTSAPAQFTGAGSKTGITAGSFFAAGLIAIIAM